MILVVVMLRWLLRVSVHVTLNPHVASTTPHVLVAFVVLLERFIADPLTIVGFLVQRPQIFLVDPVTQRKRLDILGRSQQP